ncbi:hypothetical protein [Oceanobacillus neutriphilus]|uniref:Fur-regulated basic protein A n=1 Tax=Oceanobacillus neutriphilus TaxID=531815 RepID=A0ABQ2P3U6_9BACI|nr:hypothetical protein [Oceanobacillus neutriphilus]GGP17384.1 hypothetical protein GCM10011346_52880 [Oceanobacillus neutriphilus]
MSNELHVSDIEDKIQEKMEQYEQEGKVIRLDELSKLAGWIANDEDY